MRSLVHALCARVIFRILTGEVVKTVLVNDFDSKGLRVNIKVERLLSQFLERIEDNSVRNAEFAFLLLITLASMLSLLLNAELETVNLMSIYFKLIFYFSYSPI